MLTLPNYLNNAVFFLNTAATTDKWTIATCLMARRGLLFLDYLPHVLACRHRGDRRRAVMHLTTQHLLRGPVPAPFPSDPPLSALFPSDPPQSRRSAPFNSTSGDNQPETMRRGTM